MVRLLIHEVLHVMHPQWTENEVRLETKRQLRIMTYTQKATFLRDAMKRAKVGYPERTKK
jgi:hypothetical protein